MEERRIIPQDEILAAANQVAQRLSDVGDFDQEVQAPEVLAFARYALELRSGQVIPVSPISLLGVPEGEKPKLAQERVRQLLSPLAIESKPRGYRMFFYKGIRELQDFLGAGSRTKLVLAVEGLSDVERELLFMVAPVSLLQDLGYLDLETCKPIRLAQYIRNAAFERSIGRRDDILEMLVVSAVERADQQEINLAEVVDILCQLEEKELVFSRLVESAQWIEFRDQLSQFFNSHHQTAGLVEQVRNEDVNIDNPPKNRLSSDR